MVAHRTRRPLSITEGRISLLISSSKIIGMSYLPPRHCTFYLFKKKIYHSEHIRFFHYFQVESTNPQIEKVH